MRVSGTKSLQMSLVPIILFSGYTDFPLEQRLDASAYEGFLAKPFAMDALVAIIRKVLAR